MTGPSKKDPQASYVVLDLAQATGWPAIEQHRIGLSLLSFYFPLFNDECVPLAIFRAHVQLKICSVLLLKENSLGYLLHLYQNRHLESGLVSCVLDPTMGCPAAKPKAFSASRFKITVLSLQVFHILSASVLDAALDLFNLQDIH